MNSTHAFALLLVASLLATPAVAAESATFDCSADATDCDQNADAGMNCPPRLPHCIVVQIFCDVTGSPLCAII